MANTTEPIRDLSKVNEMRTALGNERDRMLLSLIHISSVFFNVTNMCFSIRLRHWGVMRHPCD